VDPFRSQMKELSNWGRWGADDEIGTLNLLSAEGTRESCTRLVTRGETISCARPLRVGPTKVPGTEFVHHMLQSGEAVAEKGFASTSDWFGSGIHGFEYTHLDSPAHVIFDGQLYNGHPASSCTTARGALKCGIELAGGGIVTRGILFDGPTHFAKDYLEPGDVITAADLEAWFSAVGVTPRPGDALLVRLGRDRWEQHGILDPVNGAPGMAPDTARWLRAHDTVILASDYISDAIPSLDEECRLPVHGLAIVALGMWVLDNAELGALARRCREEATHEFLFMVSPLVMHHGTGSPVNPLAVL
jgi:kynurenine formamidase